MQSVCPSKLYAILQVFGHNGQDKLAFCEVRGLHTSEAGAAAGSGFKAQTPHTHVFDPRSPKSGPLQH